MNVVLSVFKCIITLIPKLDDYFKEREEFKHALGNTKIRQLFNEFSSKADGEWRLFNSALDAINYAINCGNINLEPKTQYFTNKENELNSHPEWFEKTAKTFIIRPKVYRKYKKIILNAINEDDKDCKDINSHMVESAKKYPGKVTLEF